MFEEVPFDDGDASSTPTNVSTVPPSISMQRGPADIFLSFHRPGDSEFSSTAGSSLDVDALYDARSISGDSWVSRDCRCTRCESLRVLSEIGAMNRQRSPSHSLVLVLLDMDNFGFNQFKSVPPRGGSDTNSGFNALDNIYVWAFFGSCFARYHKLWPDKKAVCESLPRETLAAAPQAPPRSGAGKRTIWQQLVQSGRVHFTPCGGHSQAADHVLLQVIGEVSRCHSVVLVTGDVKLIKEVKQQGRRIGRKSMRDAPLDDMGERLTVINVVDMGKRFVPVWRALCARVQHIVHSRILLDSEE